MKSKLIVISSFLVCTSNLYAGSTPMQDVFSNINNEKNPRLSHSSVNYKLIKFESGRFCNEHSKQKGAKSHIADPQHLQTTSIEQEKKTLKGEGATQLNCDKTKQVS